MNANNLIHSTFAQPGEILNAIAINNSGTFLASGSADGIIYLYDLDSKDKLHEIEAHEGSIWSLQFTKNGMGLPIPFGM